MVSLLLYMSVEDRSEGYKSLVDEIITRDHSPLYRDLLTSSGPHELLNQLHLVRGRYATAERMTVRRYFETPGLRTPNRDLFWARMGEAKELQAREAIRKTEVYFNGLGVEYGYGPLMAEAQKVVEELGHAQGFFTLVSTFSYGRTRPNSLNLSDYPIQVAFGQVRRDLWQNWDFDLGKAVAEDFEGGGGAHILALTEVREGPFTDVIARVARSIYRQEIAHMNRGGGALKRFAPDLTADQWAHIFEMNHRSGSLRVPARGEQFSYPWSVEEARNLIADAREGRLEPFIPVKI
ncbi:hypothetical protein HYS93_00520 [Candidatus Daviesbacteria bacterium]|nr:hypothetical protein [Candidatus Daviesbacteria bacterium]